MDVFFSVVVLVLGIIVTILIFTYVRRRDVEAIDAELDEDFLEEFELELKRPLIPLISEEGGS